MWRHLTVALALMLLAACGSGTSLQACSKAGCSDGVTYSISEDLSASWPRPLIIETCVDQYCSTREVPTDREVNHYYTQVTLEPGTLNRDSEHRTSIRVTDEAGRVLLERSDTVRLNTTAPNGFECGPVCGQGGIEVTADDA